MSEQKHTPGPWTWKADDECLVGPHQVVMRQDEEGRKSFAQYPDGTHHANARLIAAAPDMLEALKGLLQQNEEFCQRTGLGDTDQMEAARAAISKALTP